MGSHQPRMEHYGKIEVRLLIFKEASVGGRVWNTCCSSVSLGLRLRHLFPCENECLQIAGVNSNGVKDPKVRELAICAEPVHGLSADAKDGGNFFDGQ